MIRCATVFALAFAAGTAAAQFTPLPRNLKIVPPADDVPGHVRMFSGIWVGKWSDNRDHTLVVESIDGAKVSFIYSWGEGFRLSDKGGFRRMQGMIDDKGALRASLPSGAELVYRWGSDQKLFAEWSRDGRVHRAILQRR